jgi:acyl-CoA dehydrogenase
MPLVFNEEQRLLRDTAREFLAGNAPVSELRRLRDQRDALGYSSELWQQMAGLGWASIILPEAYGGLDFGFIGLGAVIEETGRTLTASPLLASAVLGASAILLAGTESQKEELLPRLAGGELTTALAIDETHHHSPNHIDTTAVAAGDGYRLSGQKTYVADGHSAELLIVAAQLEGKVRLFTMPRDTDGVTVTRTLMVDSRNAANIAFDDVVLPTSALLGTAEQVQDILDQVLDRGRVALAAEMLGIAQEVFERTVDYLKEREQFGVKIGSFQALQHRAAQLQAEIELCRSIVMQALTTVDEAPEQLPLIASLAKARLNELAKWATNEAVQMHGGIGVTDDLEIGFFLKRARVTMQLLGDTGFHRDRYASLSGY